MKPVSAQSFLYFIANDTGQVKIGISRQPDKRLKGLSTASASKLTLLASLHGGRTEEREWHTRFAQKRVSLEWFTLDDELHAAINEACSAVPLFAFHPKTLAAPKRAKGLRSGDRELRLSKRIQAFLKSRHPRNTAYLVGAETGISTATISKMFERNSCPSTESMLTYIYVYGIDFMRIVHSEDFETPWVTRAFEDAQADPAVVHARNQESWSKLSSDVAVLAADIQAHGATGGFL